MYILGKITTILFISTISTGWFIRVFFSIVAATLNSNGYNNGEAANLQYYSENNQVSQEQRAGNDVLYNNSQIYHSNTSTTNEESTNGNNIHSLRNTFQLNIPSQQRSLQNQSNVPKYCNTSTSNLNLNAVSQKVHINWSNVTKEICLS